MAWTLYKELKYALDGIPAENLTDFSKRFLITTDADIAAELGSGGGVKVTSADGMTDLAFGLRPDTNLAAGTVHLNVKIPSLLTAANVGDVIARLYYSSGESTTQNKSGAVSAYSLFMPLGEDPSGSAPQMFDWVSASNIGTSNGSMTSGDLIAGQVGNGLDFDGSNDYILTTNAGVTGTGALSVSAIARTSSSANQCMVYWGTVAAAQQFHFAIENGVLWSRNGSNTANAGSGYADGAARHFALTKPSGGTVTGLTFYANGSSVSKSTSGSANLNFGTTNKVNIGRSVASSDFFAGLLDEVRIRSVESSANWIAYEYQDDFDNANTFTLSAEQGGGGGGTNRRRRILICGASV